ncbi:MAG: glycosyltransferase family 2 protein [Actinomycetota bacterium]
MITPTLDPGPRLERCIQSVAAQTYPNVEHIVVDGGSTDGTAELLSGTQGTRWVSEPDSGQAAAINKGFALARGAILGWLNADDALTPRAIELVVDAFRARTDAGWVYGDVKVTEGVREEIERPARLDKPLTWAVRNIAAQPGSFNARWALERVGYLDEGFHYMMDCDLWLRLIDAGIPGVYVPETLAVFEVHEGSKSGRVSHAEFLVEEALARLKSGRARTAAVAFGRAAAWASLQKGAFDERRALTELKKIVGSVHDRRRDLPIELARAGLATEGAVLDIKARGVRALPRLLDARLWRIPETRMRLRQAAGRELRRKLQAVPRHKRWASRSIL